MTPSLNSILGSAASQVSLTKPGLFHFSALTIAAFAIYFTQGSSFLTLKNALLRNRPKGDDQNCKSSSQSPKTHKKTKSAPKVDSLFPSIIYNDISSTNESIVACATDTSVSYVPIQSADGLLSWDLMALDDLPFMMEQGKAQLGDLPLIESRDQFSSSNTSSISSPVEMQMEVPEFIDGLNINRLINQLPSLPHSALEEEDFSSPDHTSQSAYTPPGTSFAPSFDASALGPLDTGFLEDLQSNEIFEESTHQQQYGMSSRNSSIAEDFERTIFSPENSLIDFNFDGIEDEFFDQLQQQSQKNLPLLSEDSLTCSPTHTDRHFSVSSNSDSNGESGKKQGGFQCPHCPSHFRIRGYLTRHMKKHATNKAYSCPFYNASDKTPCHPSGGFSRRDTYKTHLKARHFLYPAGTRSEHRSKVAGICSACGIKFDSNETWVEEHIHNGQCEGLPAYD